MLLFMWLKFAALFTIFLYHSGLALNRHGNLQLHSRYQNGAFFTQFDHILIGETITSVYVPSMIMCNQKCLAEPGCYSFNYQLNNKDAMFGLCELLRSVVGDENNQQNLQYKPGFVFTQIYAKNHDGSKCWPKTDKDDCSPNPCKNGGICIDEVDSYKCSCKPGFSGTNCETDIDDCTPCQNEGTCTDGVDSHKCACKQGYNGINCEIAIRINIAYNKSTAQSSIYNHNNIPGRPSRAVDNNTNGNYDSQSCTHTNHEDRPWWRVDLNFSMQVSRVVIYNRVDECCDKRLDNFDIRVGDSLTNNGNDNAICAEGQSLVGLAMKEINCRRPLHGRFLNIQLQGYDILTLCEVKVFSI